ncbi:MAG TPA: ABC transporter permease [Blastocatellia bacterium]|nr:ABC transporter permease [Blastocatellia bacterium]
MGNLFQDIRYSLRLMLEKPGFSVVVILTLALGIGANTAIFCIVNAVLIRPLPFREPDRLVMVWETNWGKGVSQGHVSPANLIDWRDQSQAFDQLEAFDTTVFTVVGSDEAERVSGSRVSPELFRMLDVDPVRGRIFSADEAQPGQDQVAIIGHGLWQRLYSSDPDIIGRTIRLDNKSYEVIGVMPPGFDFPKSLEPAGSTNTTRPELWTPLALRGDELSLRGARYLSIIGRLKPALTAPQAQAQMEPIARELEQRFQENQGYTITVMPLYEQMVGRVRTALFIFLGAISFVLLIACANVANLLLARASARQKEMAIRLALGCTRARLVRQLLTESMLLAILGGIAGYLLAMWGIGLILTSLPEAIPRSGEIRLDAQVFGFTLGISILSGLLFGIIPALHASRSNLNESLKEGGRGSGQGSSPNRTRNILVVSEVALALVLLIGGGLLIRSFVRLTSVPPGFDPENLVAMRVALPASKYGQPHQKASFFKQLIERVESLPNVRSVAATTNLPLSGTNMSFRFMIEGRPAPPSEILLAQYHAVSPNYFGAMGIPLLQGRDFTERDTETAPAVVIINETLARRFFPGEDPVGKQIKVTYGKPVPREIVGVIKDVKHKSLEANSQEQIYIPYFQNPWAFMTLVARTDSAPENLAAALKSEVRAMDKDQPIDSIKTGEQLLSASVSRSRFYAQVLAAFAAIAVILAALGIYGVISYSVLQRTHEVGVRMALGARREDVMILILKQGLVLALVGVAIGLTAAFGLTRLMSNLLFDVSRTDAFTFVLVPLLLVGVALIASYIPARRATKVDPMIALRYE